MDSIETYGDVMESTKSDHTFQLSPSLQALKNSSLTSFFLRAELLRALRVTESPVTPSPASGVSLTEPVSALEQT